MAEIAETDCCALGQLRIRNQDTVDSIKDAIIDFYKQNDEGDYNKNDKFIVDKAVKLQAYFAVTLPQEKKAIKTLKKVGFKRLATFRRRPCCIRRRNDDRMLTMWFKRGSK